MLGFLLSKIFSFGKFLADFWQWLTEDWLRMVVAILLGLLVFQTISKGNIITARDQFELKWKEEHAAHLVTVSNYRAASLEATLEAQKNKERVETKYVEIENAQDRTIRDRLDVALNSLRQRAASAHSSGANTISGAGVADASFDPLGGSEGTLMDDLTICTSNTVKAKGWQDWFKTVSDVDRAGS
jgi:hypothetical protein